MKKRLTVVISHPIQYHAPLYAYAQKAGLFDIHVIYHNDRGVRPYFEKIANSMVSYDNDLLSGYSYEFLTKGDPQTASERLLHLTLPALERRIRRSKPDAVYFHGYKSPAHIRAIFKLQSAKFKRFMRGENEDVLPRPAWKNAIREATLKQLIPRLDAMLYIGIENKNFFLRRGVSEKQLFFVPYSADNEYFGIDLSTDERSAIRHEICAEYGIDPTAVIFVNTCKHRAEKRPKDLVAAYLQARKNDTSGAKSTLLLVGDGPQHAEMKQMVEEANISGVVFAGYVNQSKLKKMLLASDYCVNPAEEPWGCVFNEALPSGLGLISSDHVVGWPDMVRVEENGFIYPCGDIGKLAEILTKCAQHPEWCAHFSAVSKQVAREYSYQTCVEGLNEALNARTS